MARKRKRKEWTAEFRQWYEERYGATDRKLLERIEYHRQKAAEERAARGAASEDAA
jgi:hypothetical protein